ncbi:NTE family protein [Arenibacter nanhaiticus]|uniref:NTE family protein n=1 Tax=Arenibacter nanhaiticus TaxID=558155 RepID=A0A1M6GAI7_9FLAO|nr:patatin-like phospholipase family protein [Arenibacter nanhaiticus]SHJ06928.1 NTE family protein [Arenibacter nanhaiticus]
MNTGLVLSGGGVRGIAHIGAIKALEEMNIFPTHIAGTSSGAIVGALYATGLGWEEILEFFKTVQIFNIKKYARNKPGIVDTDKFYDQLASYIAIDSFESLKKPLFITATNILDGTLKVFHQGELIRPVLASAAFPGVFAPIKIQNSYYSDGGILNNFPSDLIKIHCDQMIGIYVNPFESIKIEDLKSSYNVIERAYKIKMANDSMLKFKECDLVVTPRDLKNYNSFFKKDIDILFNIGYEAMINAFKTKNSAKSPHIATNIFET